jgi:HPt (histidine-containing phosphotransfer) domain-containing protein
MEIAFQSPEDALNSTGDLLPLADFTKKHLKLRDKMSVVTLDLEFTRANLDHDRELVRALIQIAIDDLPSLVVKLRAALSNNETERLRQLSHAIKGLASNFRAEPLTRLSGQLETTSSELQQLTVKQLVDEVSIACECTVLELFDEKSAHHQSLNDCCHFVGFTKA